MEAEIKAMGLQGKECWQPLKAQGEKKMDFLLEAPGGISFVYTLVLAL